jgi:hypothetical protein
VIGVPASGYGIRSAFAALPRQALLTARARAAKYRLVFIMT